MFLPINHIVKLLTIGLDTEIDKLLTRKTFARLIIMRERWNINDYCC